MDSKNTNKQEKIQKHSNYGVYFDTPVIDPKSALTKRDKMLKNIKNILIKGAYLVFYRNNNLQKILGNRDINWKKIAYIKIRLTSKPIRKKL